MRKHIRSEYEFQRNFFDVGSENFESLVDCCVENDICVVVAIELLYKVYNSSSIEDYSSYITNALDFFITKIQEVSNEF
jgi:hypothetical protein